MGALGWLLNLDFAGGGSVADSVSGYGMSPGVAFATLSYDVVLTIDDDSVSVVSCFGVRTSAVTGRGCVQSVAYATIEANYAQRGYGLSPSAAYSALQAFALCYSYGLSGSTSSADLRDANGGAISGRACSPSVAWAVLTNVNAVLQGRGLSGGVAYAELIPQAAPLTKGGAAQGFTKRYDTGRAGGAGRWGGSSITRGRRNE